MPSPIPAEHSSRERDERRRHTARTSVAGSDGSPVGPTLARLTGRKDGPRPVRDWFEAWRRSPQARLFVSDVEWLALARGAVLLAQYHDPDVSASVRVQTFNAIRTLEASLGGLITDRVKAHVKVRPPEPAPQQAAPVADYRRMLAG